MKTAAVCPATLAYTDDGVPWSPSYGDVYHSHAGALAQARHVFLGGNGIPHRWRGRERFVVLETGFGLGNNFLATWDAWRNDEQRCGRLHYVSIEKQPLSRADLVRTHTGSSLGALADQLVAAWPLVTHNLHRLSFEHDRMQLLLALGDVAAWLPEIVARADAFYLDGFAPQKNPAMWERRVFKALARLAAPGATAATWSVAREVRDALRESGFEVEKASGFGGKREMTVARYAPRFVPRRPPARMQPPCDDTRHAVIVGAGLAGCATALALAEQGWSSLLLDRHAHLASEASGNLAGLFHGSVHPQDGVHARFNRAAALEVERWMRAATALDPALGSAGGLLRVETARSLDSMRATVDALSLPEDYVRAVDDGEARVASGLPLSHPAWLFPGGGWANPRLLSRCFVAAAGGTVHYQGSIEVATLRRHGSQWQLLDDRGQVIAQAMVVVLANASGALRLLRNPNWPLRSVRGQVTTLSACSPGLRLPLCPVAGAGYVLPPVDGQLLFGATSHPLDEDATLREADQQSNLASMRQLTNWHGSIADLQLGGRVAWRLIANDKLPLIGAVPDARAASHAGGRLDQARFVPRLPGLYVYTALASRGITWSLLGARTIASLITGAPCPVEASLLDAVDAGRFTARAARQSTAT